MSNQTIRCSTPEQFHEAVAAMVRAGLTFEADANSLTIHLLGGF